MGSWEGREAMVKLLLGRDDIDVNLRDSSDRMPLSWGAREDDTVKLRSTVKIKGKTYLDS